MNDYDAQIRALFALVPRKEGWASPKYAEYGKRKYRGKERFIAGYSHSRIGSHYASGLMYERVIGYGDTQQAAIDMMKAKLTK